MREIHVFATDRDGYPLVNSTISAFDGDTLLAQVLDSNGQAQFTLSDPVDPVKIVVEYLLKDETLRRERSLAADTDSIRIPFPEVRLKEPLMDFIKQNMPVWIGLILLAAGVALGFVFTAPNDLQTFLIRALVALGAGGIASIIPGLLNIDAGLGTRLKITAGGALGVLVLLYIVSPSRLDGNDSLPINHLARSDGGNNAAMANAIAANTTH